MCNFCDSITNNDKEIEWYVRSTFADDNICEFINGDSCDACDGCYMKFTLDGYKYNGNTYVSVGYRQHIWSEDGKIAIISPFSESMQFNYCPSCGKQISDNIKDINNENNVVIRNNKQ